MMRDIVPILSADLVAVPPKLFGYEGTGFVAAPHVLVTCCHCVATARPGTSYCALIVMDDGSHTLHVLSDITQDQNGADLATATVDLVPHLGLEIGANEITTGPTSTRLVIR
jgi:hypothetical protein